ncbi:luciferin sulfotransferase-like [Malaya genurostris]|uniref:luciferin sulfotransferase-like n=1 Tax=Malaya genurostris TaxID=325434 RepID=UPI0026F3BA50|nr:luciferin sulfotransferase-like [Malaya genurostris]
MFTSISSAVSSAYSNFSSFNKSLPPRRHIIFLVRKTRTMSFEYLEIKDSVYKTTCEQRNEEGYILVEPKDYNQIPVTLPHWKPEPCCLNERFKNLADRIKHMNVRADDVWLVTYPKSGTTWCQEMIWLICNDLDYESADNLQLDERFPFMEINGLRDLLSGRDYYQTVLSMKSPRFIKTHLPVGFLPDQIWCEKPKLIYVKRNPKAVAVSYYHHSVSLHGYKGTLDQFVLSMLNELQYYSPYHRHVLEYNNLEYGGAMLHLCFEDMKKDLTGTLKQVCQFFNKLYSDQQLAKLAQHLSFESMKHNPTVNRQSYVEHLLKITDRDDKINDANYQFMRRGESTGWKNELSTELSQRIDRWTEQNVGDPKQRELFRCE